MRKAPRLILGSGSAFMEMVAEQLRRRGWDVHTAPSEETVRAAVRKNPVAVVLPVAGGVESGYLTAVKLRKAKPKTKVVLVGDRTAAAEKMARFVGAEFAAETEGVCGLLTAFATGARC
jgi:DNA-binding response OmpR family regulator